MHAAGKNKRGKYTLVNRCVWLTRLTPPCETAFAKKTHGSRPAYTKIGYGTPSDGMRAKAPKNMEKITMVQTGWRIAQAAPITVCLYRTLMSRHTKK